MVDNVAQHKTSLLTGCAGFLGSHLCDKLIANGWNVIGIDNLMSGSMRNLIGAQASGMFKFVEHDVTEPFSFEAGLVLNLACPASPLRYQMNPIHTLKTSVFGVLNAAEIALKSGGRIFQSSTSEIYGDPEVHPQTENYRGSVNTIGPRACYDEGKRAAETILFDFNRKYGLKIRVSRIFNTYGPRMDPFDGRVVSNFIRQALMGEAITIYGTGAQTRSFCYVDDMVEGIWRLIFSEMEAPQPINLGNPEELTVLELAEMIRDMVGRSTEIKFEPIPVDDPVRRKPDISRAKTALGWEPKIGLREGLARTIDYFETIISSGAIDEYAAANPLKQRQAAE